MDDPTFRLESIVQTHDGLEDFEGPLTLILQLLSKNKIELEDIKISVLLDQYLAYLDEMKAMDLEIASEFVVMASHLVYIKTKMLLNTEEEVSELQELISSLEKLRCRDAYARIRGITGEFEAMYRRGAGYIVKQPEPLPVDKTYRYVHETEDILNALRRALDRGADAPEPPPLRFALPQRIVYSIDKKTDELVLRLRQSGSTRVLLLFNESRSRSELVATFVAILELCKMGRITLRGDGDELAAEYAPETPEVSDGTE